MIADPAIRQRVLGAMADFAGRQSRHRPRPRIMREAADMRTLAQLLDMFGLLWMHPVNEAGPHRRAGVKAGVPDVLIFDPPPAYRDRCGVAIELKSPRGRASHEQREWIAALGGRGWVTAICTLDEAISLLRECGWTLPAAKLSPRPR